MIWEHTTAPWFSDLYFSLMHSATDISVTASLSDCNMTNSPCVEVTVLSAQCVSVTSLESLVEYIISDCTICTSGGHLLASAFRRSRAWGTASFFTQGLIQVGPWLYWRAHSSSAHHLCVWWTLKHHTDIKQRLAPVSSFFPKIKSWSSLFSTIRVISFWTTCTGDLVSQ